MSSTTGEESGAERPRPKGGYEAISVLRLAMAWWAYREGHITKLAMRAYFGCIELEIRRRLSGGKYQPSLAGLRKLVGGPETGQGGVRAALKQLLAVGLVRSCSKSGIVFAETAEELRVEDRSGLDAMLDQLQGLRRKVPVPRRMLRRLAGGLGKARTAVVLAHLIRCLFYRKGEGINAVGCCKASWIAEVFGITERSVHDARKFLILELGWLIPRDCSQRVLNRDGLWVSVNLAWGPEGQGTATDLYPVAEPSNAPAADEISPPPTDFAGHFSGPSTENKKPLTGLNNQKPAGGGTTGFSNSNSQSESNPQEQEPRLDDIVPADLRETGRLLELHRQAIERKLLTASEADRLKFLAGAAHAQAVGSNPCRLFAWMLRGGRWEFITQADEDEAQAKLKAWNRSAFEAPPPDVPRPTRPTLSKDALVVQELTQVLRARGIHADPFRAVRQHLPEWTRERWDAAAAELDRARQCSGSSNLPALGTILGGVVAGEAELRNRY